jgi:ribokinase
VIVVFGTVNVDMITRVPRLPSPGQEVKGRALEVMPGGKGANQALAALRAGGKVALGGAVGADPLAEIALAGIRAAGVDLARVAVSRTSGTGSHMVAIDGSGENLMIGADGANLDATADLLDGAFGPDVVFLTQNSLTPSEVARAIAAAAAAGARIVFNAAPTEGTVEASFAAAEVIVVNEHEGLALARRFGLSEEPGEIAAGLSGRFDADVVVTLGSAGLRAATRAGRRLIGRPPRIAALDTTGAGDAFCGTLAAALDRGETFETALAEGLAAGALACRTVGAQGGARDLDEIRAAARQAVVTDDG